MRIYLAGLIILLGMALFVARQDERSPQQGACKTTQLDKTAIPAKSNEDHSQENISNPERDAPRWYGFFRWPNGTAAWGLILTLVAIVEQTKQTARAAAATETAVETAARSFTLQDDTAKRQLRAYFGTPEGKLYIGSDGSVEPRLTFTNCGQTPAYALQIIECGWFEETSDKRTSEPGQPVTPPQFHIVGARQPYYFTCAKRPSSAPNRETLIIFLSADYIFKMNGKCTYKDAFGDDHWLKFQLVIGGGTPLQYTKDETGGWYGLLTDSEGNDAD